MKQTLNFLDEADEEGLLDADCFESLSPQFDLNAAPSLNTKQPYAPGMAVFTIMEAEDSDEEDY